MNSVDNKDKGIFQLGIISDTHGLLRPEAVRALEGSDMIIHAGDVGSEDIIDRLSMIAPVIAVRGNMDSGNWAYRHSITETVEVNGKLIYIVHNLSSLDLDPAVSHIDAVVSGHSHRPSVSSHRNVLYVNPGSAGPRRFTLPVTVAILTIEGDTLDAQIVHLTE